jgi:hypothetical protein
MPAAWAVGRLLPRLKFQVTSLAAMRTPLPAISHSGRLSDWPASIVTFSSPSTRTVASNTISAWTRFGSVGVRMSRENRRAIGRFSMLTEEAAPRRARTGIVVQPARPAPITSLTASTPGIDSSTSPLTAKSTSSARPPAVWRERTSVKPTSSASRSARSANTSPGQSSSGTSASRG